MQIDDGYVLLSRVVFESSLWKLPPDDFRIATYLICKARHSDKPFVLMDGTVINRGELVTSMSRIAEDCSYYENRSLREYSRKKILNILSNLEQIGFITRNSHSKGTHVSVCNYGLYQNPDNYNSHAKETRKKHRGNTEETPREHGLPTNNNENNENNENNDKKSPPEKSGLKIDDILLEIPESRRLIIKEWLAYKAEKKKAYVPRGLKSFISQHKDMSDQRLKAAIEFSMAQGYSGVYEPSFTTVNDPSKFKQTSVNYMGQAVNKDGLTIAQFMERCK